MSYKKLSDSNMVRSFKTIFYIVAILWILLGITFFLPFLKNYGIRPRTLAGLPGILIAPFLHANAFHLLENSIGLFILGFIFLITERKLSGVVILNIIIIGGLGTWLIGRTDCGGGSCSHIGASGVIYGILGYLLAIGIFTRNLKAIIVSAVVFILFVVKAEALRGIFPSDRAVSWEYHLCGFLAGILTAKFYARRNSSQYMR